VVFHEADKMWYTAVVDGIYAAPEPAGSYYVITFVSIPGCQADPVSGQQVSVFGPSIRVKDAQLGAAYAHRLAEQQQRIDERVGQLNEFFAQVDQEDGEQLGDLGRDEVREVLRLLGADATDDQVELIFRHYDSDHSGTVSRDEFEMCLSIVRGGYTPPGTFTGLNYEPEITEESSDAEWARLRAGALVAVYHPVDGLWTRGAIEEMHIAERRDGAPVRFCTVTCCTGESLIVYPEAVRVKETELSHTTKQWLSAYDADGDGILGRSEVMITVPTELREKHFSVIGVCLSVLLIW
jgi:Ca2+-binding EF-hand superfamily protein